MVKKTAQRLAMLQNGIQSARQLGLLTEVIPLGHGTRDHHPPIFPLEPRRQAVRTRIRGAPLTRKELD